MLPLNITPINIHEWTLANSDLLKPPVNNYCLHQSAGMTVMLISGPNKRTDFHVNPTPEWFYQVKGRMCLRIALHGTSSAAVIGGEGVRFEDVWINEGESYILPPFVPHSPIRFSNTLGIVVEVPRQAGLMDKLRWYCPSLSPTPTPTPTPTNPTSSPTNPTPSPTNQRSQCGIVYEEEFVCVDLGVQLKTVIDRFYSDADDGDGKRRCRGCGAVCPVPEGYAVPTASVPFASAE